MTTKKIPKLTKVEELQRRISILESALYQAFTDYEEMQTMIIMLRECTKGETFSKYWVHDYCQAMMTNSIANQHQMMDNAGLDDY